MNLSKQDFDVIIVGTGPGGSTVAKELSRMGKKVLMLEWGKGEKIKGTFSQYVTSQLLPGKSLLFTNNMLGMVRGITTGGSSVFNYATCFPVPFDMLKKYGIDITDEVREALAELPVAPLKDEMITPMANRLMETAHELGYNWEKLDKFMFQDKWKSEYGFGYYGDSHGVKWSALNYVEEALDNGAVLLNEAKVKKVIIDGKKAVGVEFNMRGKSYTVTASKIVLAAGGIGTPVIMRNSGVKGVGYNYFFDPLITVCGKIKDIKKQSNEIPMSAGCHMEDEGYMMTDMALPFMLEKIFASQVLHFHRLFESDNTIRIMIKAKDTLGGRLTDTGGVRKKLIKEDRQKLMKGYERAKKILEVAGATGIYKTWYLAAHPGGTVKIGEFLDSDLKTEYDNLYVCDCSVIPEPWGLPPVMTIIGLGKYLSKHLGSI